MINGNLVDIAFPDLLQFVHMSGRSGTLYLERDQETAYISFHHGRIASAWCPAATTVVEYLTESGRLGAEEVARAVALQDSLEPKRTLGQVLLSIAAITREDLRKAVAHKIEQTVFELIAWRRGVFRFVVEEVRYDEELLFAPGEIVPQVELDAQAVLIDALRLSDELSRESRPFAVEAARAVAASRAAPARAARPSTGSKRIDVVTKDAVLFHALRMDELGRVCAAPWQDAGRPIDGEGVALAVCDTRGDSLAFERIAKLRHDHPEVAIVAIVADPSIARAAYDAGAACVVFADAAMVSAACVGLFAASRSLAGVPAPSAGIARLRRLHQDIRSGLVASKLSVNLMALFAQAADRGVLFAVRREALAVLASFGRSTDGVVLPVATRGMRMILERDGPLGLSLATGTLLEVDWDVDELPAGLQAVLGAPAVRRGVLIPVAGAQRVMAVIYCDNGARPEPVADVDVLELAAGQFGLAIENQILRKAASR